ncbi:MAG: hypothetical protein JXB38_11225 [Anaerolineales bacterium]|nr:hypothetical protein [Anaerolineales bacterium]
MNKFRFSIAIIIFIALSAKIALACSPIPDVAIIACDVVGTIFDNETTCLNEDCSVQVIKRKSSRTYPIVYKGGEVAGFGDAGIEIWDYIKSEDAEILIEALDTACHEDFGESVPEMAAVYRDWIENIADSSFYHVNDLTYEPYSSTREQELSAAENKLLQCNYTSHERIGDWLVTIDDRTRAYCRAVEPVISWCSSERDILAPLPFVKYLLQNLNRVTLSYLAGIVGLLGVSTWFGVYLVQMRQLAQFFIPTARQAIVYVVILFLITAPGVVFFYVPPAEIILRRMIGTYVLFCLIWYWVPRFNRKNIKQ